MVCSTYRDLRESSCDGGVGGGVGVGVGGSGGGVVVGVGGGGGRVMEVV